MLQSTVCGQHPKVVANVDTHKAPLLHNCKWWWCLQILLRMTHRLIVYRLQGKHQCNISPEKWRHHKILKYQNCDFVCPTKSLTSIYHDAKLQESRIENLLKQLLCKNTGLSRVAQQSANIVRRTPAGKEEIKSQHSRFGRYPACMAKSSTCSSWAIASKQSGDICKMEKKWNAAHIWQWWKREHWKRNIKENKEAQDTCHLRMQSWKWKLLTSLGTSAKSQGQ